METLVNILPYTQIGLSFVLVVAILLQSSGAGIGGALGGGDDYAATFRKKRGLEKFLYNLTIVTAILFAATAFLVIII